MRKLSSWEVMVVMVLPGFLEDTKPLRSGDAEGRRRRRKDGGGAGGVGEEKTTATKNRPTLVVQRQQAQK